MSENTNGSGRPSETPYPKKKVHLKKGDTTKTPPAAHSDRVEDQATLRYRGLTHNTTSFKLQLLSLEQAQGSTYTVQTPDNSWKYFRAEAQTCYNQIGFLAQQRQTRNGPVPRATVDDASSGGQVNDLQFHGYNRKIVRGSTVPRIPHSASTLSPAEMMKGGSVGASRRGYGPPYPANGAGSVQVSTVSSVENHSSAYSSEEIRNGKSLKHV